MVVTETYDMDFTFVRAAPPSTGGDVGSLNHPTNPPLGNAVGEDVITNIVLGAGDAGIQYNFGERSEHG